MACRNSMKPREPLDESRGVRLGITPNALGAASNRGDRALGRAEAVERRRKIEQRPIAKSQPGTNRRLIAAMLNREGRVLVEHSVCFASKNVPDRIRIETSLSDRNPSPNSPSLKAKEFLTHSSYFEHEDSVIGAAFARAEGPIWRASGKSSQLTSLDSPWPSPSFVATIARLPVGDSLASLVFGAGRIARAGFLFERQIKGRP